MNKIPVRLIGKVLVAKYGLKEVTSEFNRYRKALGLKSVKTQTVNRYNGKGEGYDNTPMVYSSFLMNFIQV